MAQADSPKMGRPSKLTDEVMAKVEDYIKNYANYGDPFPSAAGLADELGISRKTIYNWADSSPDFLRMLDAINAKQERVLLANGITGEFNAAITKLVLAKHDYSDKVSQDVTSSDGSMKPTVIELVGVSSESSKDE